MTSSEGGCQHVREGGQNVTTLYCGKPAKHWLSEYAWKLCGVHARFWQNRGFEVIPLGLEPLDDNGDHMTWEKFINCVTSGGFIDYDGYAELATATHASEIIVSPSKAKSFKRPAWATHVVWYNR